MTILHQLSETMDQLIVSAQSNFPMIGSIIAITFAIQCTNFLCQYRLCVFGIMPRHPLGLIGIVLSPWIHGSFNHFFSNAMIFLALANLVALEGQMHFLVITLMIAVLGGGATWLFGRKALHVGASGVIMGYWGYLLVNAYQHPSLITIALGVTCFYFFGGLLSHMIPDSAKESWEGHVFGVVSGIVSALTYPTIEPWILDNLL